ncbi:MAG: hypothetical protein ACTSYI_02475 [Promethearchaeota archaeon]
MEDTQFILGNRQKSLIILPYLVLSFFLFIEIRDNLQPEIYFKDATPFEIILSTIIMLSMAFAFFFVINYFFRKKVLFTQTGIILKKYLRKRISVEWSSIELINIKIYALDTSITGSFADSNSSDKEFVPNLKKFGNWDISIKTAEKEHKIKLHQVPFSNISEVNPLIFSNSNLKYLSCQELNNPKTQELLWSWKSEGTHEEIQETTNLIEEPAMSVEHNLFFSPEFEDRSRTFKNFLIFDLVAIVPFVYVLILFILDITKTSSNEPAGSPPFIDLTSDLGLIFILLFGLSILIIFATHWFVLPKTMEKYQNKGYDSSYFTFFLLIALNEVIVLFGLIIGILSWVEEGPTAWLEFFSFVGIGWIQMIYLYVWKIPKDFKKFSFKSSKNSQNFHPESNNGNPIF